MSSIQVQNEKKIVVMCSCPPYCLVPADILSDSCSRCQGNVLVIAQSCNAVDKDEILFFRLLAYKNN